MCGAAAIPVLKFIAPMVLPSLANRIFGGNNQQQSQRPANFQQTATPGSKLARQASSIGEDIETRDETKKQEAETSIYDKLARKRQINPFEDTTATSIPFAQAMTANLGLSGQSDMGLNTGTDLPTAASS